MDRDAYKRRPLQTLGTRKGSGGVVGSSEYPHMCFGPYRVLDVIGTGGMGTVYRARDPRLEREVALKVLRRNLSVSRARDRFLREARAVSSLSHPNICTLFDIGEQNGDPFLVMELLRGESLKDRIGRGPMDAEDIREIAFRVASALHAAHQRGIVHRDIKPANLFLIDDGHGSTDVKVLDFGLAKVTDERSGAGESEEITRQGSTVGTVEYMSPEQARGQLLDARSDLFSLGAVLYEMATGRLPFRGSTSAVVFSELLNQDPVPPREANLRVPSDLDRVIRALLVKDRERRVQSAAALLDRLSAGEEVLAGWEPVASQTAGSRVSPVSASSPTNSPRQIVAAEMNAVAGGGSATSVVTERGRGTATEKKREANGSERGTRPLPDQQSGSRPNRRSGRRSSPVTWPKHRRQEFGGEGDFSDPVAGSGERRHAVLAESSRPVPRVRFVEDEPVPWASAGRPTGRKTGSEVRRGPMLLLLLAASLIIVSVLLLLRYHF